MVPAAFATDVRSEERFVSTVLGTLRLSGQSPATSGTAGARAENNGRLDGALPEPDRLLLESVKP